MNIIVDQHGILELLCKNYTHEIGGDFAAERYPCGIDCVTLAYVFGVIKWRWRIFVGAYEDLVGFENFQGVFDCLGEHGRSFVRRDKEADLGGI